MLDHTHTHRPVTQPDHMAPPSNRRAVAAAGASTGDDDPALRHLYNTHAATLLSYLMKLTRGDRHRAEDILQETLLRAWRHPQARTSNGEWSRPWLFTVARRITIDHVRATRARPTELGDDHLDRHSHGDNTIDTTLDRSEVRAALKGLPPHQRDILIQVYFREQSVQEAADTLRIPPGTVKSRTYYALKALRQALLERGFHA